jgi:hypothetical protein
VTVSLYQLHRCVYDSVRAGEVSNRSSGEFDDSRYDLNDEERRAFKAKDVGALYELGLHPVLLNAYCRSVGFTRDDYRRELTPYAAPEERRGRWQH